MSLAWHVEAFRRSGKRFPALDKVLNRKAPKETKRQSNEEIMAAMDSWVSFTQEKHRQK